MVCERGVAAATSHYVPAVAALHNARCAAAVEEEDGLIALVYNAAQVVLQSAAEDAPIAVPQLLAHIDNPYTGHGTAEANAVRHLQKAQAASGEGPVIANHVRGCAAQNQDGVGRLCHAHGHGACVIAGLHILLLVGPFVLLIENYKAEGPQRREQGAARAYHDVESTLVDSPPGAPVLGRRKAAVYDGDAAREPGAEPLHHLWSERYFRHEEYGFPTAFKATGQRLQVDLRLAAAGNTLKKKRLVPGLGDGRVYACQSFRLVRAGH